jgi:CRP-like cAMP-binding protein
MRATPHQLCRLRPLRALSRDELAALAAAAPLRRLEPHEVLVRAGDRGSAAFLVVEGRLRVLAGGDRARVLGWALPGDLVGERALVEDHALRSASVEALEPAAVLVLEHGALRGEAVATARIALELAALGALRERLRGASAALLASGGGDRQPRGAEPEVFEAETRRLGLWSRLRPPSPGLRGSAP